jgi:ribosomal protein S18 acetylase RimI-like enzyme
MNINILQKEDLTPAIIIEISDLFKTLNADIKQRGINDVLAQGNEFICVCCWDNENLVGMASLATYKVISGHKGMVEDVVVSGEMRGKGIGRKLMETLVLEGQKLSLSEILLFSGHHRKPAIALYKSLGFDLKNSGMYTLKL